MKLTKDNVKMDELLKALSIENIDDKVRVSELSVDVLKELNKIIRAANKSNGQLSISIPINPANEWLMTWLKKTINKHNLDKSYLHKENAVKNSVVSRIKQIISSPSNQMLASVPVDVQGWHDAVKTVNEKKGAGLKTMRLSSYDMFSYYKQQRDASVGKDDVGISANGVKSLFTLTTYYNDYYENFVSDSPEYTNAEITELRRSNHVFKKKLTFMDSAGIKHNYNLATISDTLLSRNQKAALTKAIGEFEALRSNAAIHLSGFTSAATDNAKELLMAKVNASVELASVHIYLMILGFTPEQIIEIMTSDVVQDILDRMETNIFYSPETTRVNTIIDTLDGVYAAEDRKADDSKVINLKMFSEIYQGAQEVKLLSSLLGVNQRTSANVTEMNKFLTKFEQAIFTREHLIFGKSLGSLRDIAADELTESVAGQEKSDKTWKALFTKIEHHNKQIELINSTDITYMKDVIRRASNVKVFYNKEDGTRGEKFVSLVGGKFDVRYFIDQDNVEYRELTKSYYNIIKSTFNIFDIVERVPHYREMISGLTLSHNILINLSTKYNFAFSRIKDTARENAWRIIYSKGSDRNEHISNMMGNTALPIPIGKDEVNKSSLGIDILLRERWLRSDTTKKLTFNVNQLLQLAGIPSIELYTSDDARIESKLKDKTDVKTVNANDTTPTIISLDTNYGIANFKKLTEQVLLPIIQKNDTSSLAKSLKVESVYTALGIRGNAITSTHALKNLNNPISIKQFQELLTAFDMLDVKSGVTNKLTNSNGDNLKWRDVLYVYNLIVNNESYGDKRLTPLFEYYAKEEDGLGYDYIKFSSKLDNGEIDLFDPLERLNSNSDYLTADEDQKKLMENKARREIENDILFYTFNKNGKLWVKNTKSDSSELKVSNPDFVIVTSLTETKEQKRRQKEMNDLLKMIASKGFIIKFKC